MHEQILIVPTKLHHDLQAKVVAQFLVKFYSILAISHNLYSLCMCVNSHTVLSKFTVKTYIWGYNRTVCSSWSGVGHGIARACSNEWQVKLSELSSPWCRGSMDVKQGQRKNTWEQTAGLASSMNEALAGDTQVESLRNFRVSWKAVELLLITTVQGLETIPLGTMFSKHLYCWWMWEVERQKCQRSSWNGEEL